MASSAPTTRSGPTLEEALGESLLLRLLRLQGWKISVSSGGGAVSIAGTYVVPPIGVVSAEVAAPTLTAASLEFFVAAAAAREATILGRRRSAA